MEDRNKADPAIEPLVKLPKTWSMANKLALESFHIEMMVEQMWRRYKADSFSYPYALTDTLKALPDWINKAVMTLDAGGRIDGYRSTKERSDANARAGVDARNATNAETLRAGGKEPEAIELWQKVHLHHEAFPTYI